MKPPAEQELVDALQVAECERRRQQTKRDRLLIDTRAHRGEREVEFLTRAARQTHGLRERDPLTDPAARGRVRDEPEVRDRDTGEILLPLRATDRACLLEERRHDAARVASDSDGGGVQCLVGAQGVRWNQQALTRPRRGARGREKRCELVTTRGEEDDVDSERQRTGCGTCGSRSIRHRTPN
jgi:hypothetical protein